MTHDWMGSILDWFIKCFVYFIPLLLMWARYHSFLLHYKKPVVDVIVDGQFCITPFCMALEAIIGFWGKKDFLDGGMKIAGMIFFICLIVIAVILLLLYWDISYVSVQKDGAIEAASKKTMMNVILIILAAVLVLSFCMDVLVY